MLSDEYHVGHPERRERLLAMINGYLDRVGDIIRQGQREGLVRTDVNAHSLAIVFLGLIQPAGVLWVLSDGGFDVAAHARAVWPVFEQAIRAPSRRTDARTTTHRRPRITGSSGPLRRASS
jgi:hypothetical protein